MRVHPPRFFSAALLLALASLPVQGRLTRLVIESTESLGSDGYQKLIGRAYGELDPRQGGNSIITDILLAPRNARGMVEYSATFTIVKPADMSKASGTLLYFVSNRGRVALTGNGFLADARKRGDVLVASGWQADLTPAPGMETLDAPVAKNADGSSITGRVSTRFFDMPAGTNTLPLLRGRVLGNGDPATLDTSKAVLTRRAADNGQVIPLSSSEWAFADCGKTAFPGTPDPRKICLKSGFNPAYMYELIYTAKDPKVYGIGFASVRDLSSYLRYGAKDDSGAANPLDGRIKAAISQGSSQSGNYLRAYLHLGFNQDETGRIVFEGANPNIAVRLGALNVRFAAPSGSTEMYLAGSEGAVWWEDFTDEVRHLPTTGLLHRCRATNTCPKVVETFGASEFYSLRASPDLVGPRADHDIPLPSNVRRYYFSSVRHGGGRGGFAAAGKPLECCVLADNPNPSSDTLRAVQNALVDWVVKGTEPPPSQYPRLDRGELTAPTQLAMGFPVIPGIPLPDNIIEPLYEFDFGREFHYQDASGIISLQPPVVKGILPMLVPKVDADGNEVGGVSSVLLQAPLGTYTGWNVEAAGYNKDHLSHLDGAFIPFAKTRAARMAAGDPRPSLEERYGTQDKYVEAVKAAAERLVRQRFLMADDAVRLIREAQESSVLK